MNEEVGEFIGDVEEHKEDEAVLLQNVNENIQDILKDFPNEFIVDFDVTENIANIEDIGSYYNHNAILKNSAEGKAEFRADVLIINRQEEKIVLQQRIPDMQNENEHDENEEPKRKRARTENERKEKRLEKYKCLNPCVESCRKGCGNRINEVLRKTINRCNWGLPFGEWRQWLSSNVPQNEISKRSQNVVKQKSTSLSYYLPIESGIKVKVCKVVCLRTLWMKSDGMINELLKTKRKSIEGAIGIAPVKDLRGANLRQHGKY